MPTIAEKRELMGRAQKQAADIIQEARTRGVGLTADKDLEVKALIQKAAELQTEIRADVDLDQKAQQLQDMDRFLRDPIPGITHGINADDDERKALLSAGFEIKAGTIFAPTSLIQGGQRFMQPMYPEEVLFGAIPTDDRDAADFMRKTRAIFAPEYKTAFTKHMRVLSQTRDSAQAWNSLSPEEHKALAEGSDTAGGFLVPPDAQAEMLARVAQQSVIRGRARVQPTSSDILKWPAIAPNNSSAANSSIFSSGFIGGWVGETPAFSETDPSFQSFNIPVKKIRVATKLSNDLVQDAQVNILAFLAQNGSENMALVEDQGFINGDGGPMQPRGLLQAGASNTNVEGITTNTIDNNSTVLGSASKIIDLAYSLPAQYTRNASWLMQRATEGAIRKLVAGTAGFLWPLPAGGGFGPTPRELLSYPVENSDFMPPLLVDGNKVIIFGDISQYIIAQRAQISSRVLNERFADTDQVGIILFERVGGDIWNTDALRYGVV